MTDNYREYIRNEYDNAYKEAIANGMTEVEAVKYANDYVDCVEYELAH